MYTRTPLAVDAIEVEALSILLPLYFVQACQKGIQHRTSSDKDQTFTQHVICCCIKTLLTKAGCLASWQALRLLILLREYTFKIFAKMMEASDLEEEENVVELYEQARWARG